MTKIEMIEIKLNQVDADIEDKTNEKDELLKDIEQLASNNRHDGIIRKSKKLEEVTNKIDELKQKKAGIKEAIEIFKSN